jgi:hypothetical protein
VSNTWKHLGFQETSEEQLAAWDVEDGDLVHMQNTLQVRQDVSLCFVADVQYGIAASNLVQVRLGSAAESECV